MSDTILSRLQAQRTLLTDVLRQMNIAITALGGDQPITNGHVPTKKARVIKRRGKRRAKVVTRRRWTDADFLPARHDYEMLNHSVRQIAKDMGVHDSLIYARIKAQGWKRPTVTATYEPASDTAYVPV